MQASEIQRLISAGDPIPVAGSVIGEVEMVRVDNTIPTRVRALGSGGDSVRWIARGKDAPAPGDVVGVRREEAQTVLVAGENAMERVRGKVLYITRGVRITGVDANGEGVVTVWMTRRHPMTERNKIARMAAKVRARGLRWVGDPPREDDAAKAPTLARPEARRAAVGTGACVAPWWVWCDHGLRLEAGGGPAHGAGAQVILCDGDEAPPLGYREVARGEELAVTDAEMDAVRSWWRKTWGNDVSDDGLAASVRNMRNDPGRHDLCWTAPTGWGRERAIHGIGGIKYPGSVHRHVVLSATQGGWLAWIGLGSAMEAVRGGQGAGGCRFASRDEARAQALALCRQRRREALRGIVSHLDGWAREAVDAIVSGPTDGDIQVHERTPADRDLSSWQLPAVEVVDDVLMGESTP